MRDFMFTDLAAGIESKANFMVALALTTYTETWGRLVKGLPKYHSQVCYEAFLSKLGKDYEELLSQGVPLYQDIRCGLVHSYAIEARAEIRMESGNCGISYENGKYVFFILTYFDDFKKAVEQYLSDLPRTFSLQATLKLGMYGKPIIM